VGGARSHKKTNSGERARREQFRPLGAPHTSGSGTLARRWNEEPKAKPLNIASPMEG
jgi:hypothetical protein